jgi:hypothetical protein
MPRRDHAARRQLDGDRNNGAQKGWRYRDQSASAQGVKAVTIQARNTAVGSR